jgi:transcriptional regulator GlxA family with amidase domain
VEPIEIRIVCLPAFNALATMAFVDPLRAANYLSGRHLFHWEFLSTEASPRVSNTAALTCAPLGPRALIEADWIIVSASWTPERFRDAALLRQIKTAAAHGAFVGGIDTGAFVPADAGLLDGRRATVHYEHIDAFQESYPETQVVEDLFVIDAGVGSCCGGTASIDFSLHLVREACGITLGTQPPAIFFMSASGPAVFVKTPTSENRSASARLSRSVARSTSWRSTSKVRCRSRRSLRTARSHSAGSSDCSTITRTQLRHATMRMHGSIGHAVSSHRRR